MFPTEDGYRGIWYFNQKQDDEFRFKYSGGLGTYPQTHLPIAIYSPTARKTFFCYGGTDTNGQVLNMVSYFDHETGLVPRPVRLLHRQTDDAHYNPTLSLDHEGHLLVYCNSHGEGYELEPSDPTFGEAFIYRSKQPFSIDDFELVHTENFSYAQPWALPSGDFVWLHTRYSGPSHRLFWSRGTDGVNWSEPQQFSAIGFGSYQLSWKNGGRVATIFDMHPVAGQPGLNARTNIYYLQTDDGGRSWQNAAGETVEMPVSGVHNPALVHDYAAQEQLVYLKDLNFDARGRPIILFVTSHGFWSGPQSGPREWNTAHWTGHEWQIRPICPADHNYDHGPIYVEDGLWRVVAPFESGPQAGGTGGAMSVRVSRDEGHSWEVEQRFELQTGRNHSYVRRPLDAHPDFYAFWADGNAFEPSESHFYFSTRTGQVFRLPPTMTGAFARPEPMQ